MPELHTVKPGDLLFEVKSERAGNTTMKRTAVRPVRIVEVDIERRRVKAHWNGNAEITEFGEKYVRSLKRKDPRLKDKPHA